MKNEILDDLTEQAKSVREFIPELVLDGHGRFLYPNGRVVPMVEVLQQLTAARERIQKLVNCLQQQPRRKVGKKAAP